MVVVAIGNEKKEDNFNDDVSRHLPCLGRLIATTKKHHQSINQSIKFFFSKRSRGLLMSPLFYVVTK